MHYVQYSIFCNVRFPTKLRSSLINLLYMDTQNYTVRMYKANISLCFLFLITRFAILIVVLENRFRLRLLVRGCDPVRFFLSYLCIF